MVKTDASNRVIAGILSQQHSDTEWYSVVYFSKTIALAKCNYEIHNKKMLVIICSLKQWRSELEGTHFWFQIYTDHKARLSTSWLLSSSQKDKHNELKLYQSTTSPSCTDQASRTQRQMCWHNESKKLVYRMRSRLNIEPVPFYRVTKWTPEC